MTTSNSNEIIEKINKRYEYPEEVYCYDKEDLIMAIQEATKEKDKEFLELVESKFKEGCGNDFPMGDQDFYCGDDFEYEGEVKVGLCPFCITRWEELKNQIQKGEGKK